MIAAADLLPRRRREPDLLAESRHRAELAAVAAGALDGARPGDLDKAPSPREPDPVVFGEWHPKPFPTFRPHPLDNQD